MPYQEYLKHLDNAQKEYLFRADLARRLTVLNYMIAKPEPDVGEDVWIASRDQAVIFPAQLKSSYGIWHLQHGKVRKYTTTIKATKLQSSFGRVFFYFFGLYEPKSNPVWFHIGCVPSSFFQEHWEFLLQQRLQKDGRLNIEIYHSVEDETYFMFYPLVEVTTYFNNLDAIL